jgi:hypothetical protein
LGDKTKHERSTPCQLVWITTRQLTYASRIQDWRVTIQTHSPVWQVFSPLTLIIINFIVSNREISIFL